MDWRDKKGRGDKEGRKDARGQCERVRQRGVTEGVIEIAMFSFMNHITIRNDEGTRREEREAQDKVNERGSNVALPKN